LIDVELMLEGASPRESIAGPPNCAKQGVITQNARTLDGLHRSFIIEEKLNV